MWLGILVTLVLVTRQVFAYPGELDASFPVVAGGVDLAVQGDEKILIVGTTTLVRRLPDGALDPSFGEAGTAVGSIPGYAVALALDPDGGVVVAFRVGADFGVTRFTSGGVADMAFGTDGTTITSVTPGIDGLEALAIAPDGGTVVAGWVPSPTPTDGGDLFVARYDVTGTLDATFGDEGIVITDLGGTGEGALAVAIQPDGRIVAGGYRNLGPGGIETLLLRYETDGMFDPTFGDGGWTTTTFGEFATVARALVLQPDGRIVSMGQGVHGSPLTLARFESDGTPDATFGTDGAVVGERPIAAGVVPQADGRLIVVGASVLSWPALGMARYLSDGSIDATFGRGGVVTTDPVAAADAAALQGDGRLLVLGSTTLARFVTTGDPVPACVPQSPPCDDGNTCTWDQCEIDGYCIFLPLQSGASCADDGNECTEDVCAPGAACTHVVWGPKPCQDDGNPCTLDLCTYAGVCAHLSQQSGTIACADDGDPCTLDQCDQLGACMHPPAIQTNCTPTMPPGFAALVVNSNRLSFRWSRGRDTKADFGRPDAGTAYRFCLYADDLDGPATAFGATIEPGSACDADRCWSERPRGWRYRSRTGTPDGIVRFVLREGSKSGRSRIELDAVGDQLAPPALPIAEPSSLVAQLISSDGRCWSADLDRVGRNTSRALRARSD